MPKGFSIITLDLSGSLVNPASLRLVIASAYLSGGTDRDQVQRDVRRLIDELPEDQKQVLTMRIYKDMSFKEISEQTGVSINTALGRMRYALINLRKVIERNQIVLTN